MTSKTFKYVVAATTGVVFALGATFTTLASPKSGGILNFVVGSKIPSYDGHQETTFGMIHPIRPFYSLLIRVNPDNPADPADFKCDLCEGDVPAGEIERVQILGLEGLVAKAHLGAERALEAARAADEPRRCQL